MVDQRQNAPILGIKNDDSDVTGSGAANPLKQKLLQRHLQAGINPVF